jgi:hypothetical protein
MITNIEISEGITTKITFASPQSSRFSRFILQFFTLIFFVLPVISTVFTLFFLGKISPGFVIYYIMFGLSGYYFLRLFLWNKHGKEIIYLEADKIIYEADYKLFKANRTEIGVNNLSVDIRQFNISNEKFGTLNLKESDESIETVVKVPIHDMEMIKEKIEYYYANTI